VIDPSEHTGLVYHIAGKFYRGALSRTMDFDDLAGWGMIGLVKAARTFDGSKGVRFPTYAARCIANEILMALKREKRHLRDASLEEPIAEDRDGNVLRLEDALADPRQAEELRAVEASDIIAGLARRIDRLPPRWRQVMRLRAAGLTQAEIGRRLGISRCYVSRICRLAQGHFRGAA
jgi:RNA polymerase sporulation-specific sigma factor